MSRAVLPGQGRIRLWQHGSGVLAATQRPPDGASLCASAARIACLHNFAVVTNSCIQGCRHGGVRRFTCWENQLSLQCQVRDLLRTEWTASRPQDTKCCFVVRHLRHSAWLLSTRPSGKSCHLLGSEARPGHARRLYAPPGNLPARCGQVLDGVPTRWVGSHAVAGSHPAVGLASPLIGGGCLVVHSPGALTAASSGRCAHVYDL
jgi:hypothetical protein